MFIQDKKEAERPLPFIVWGFFLASLITLMFNQQDYVPWASILFFSLSGYCVAVKLFSRIEHKTPIFKNLLKSVS